MCNTDSVRVDDRRPHRGQSLQASQGGRKVMSLMGSVQRRRYRVHRKRFSRLP